MILSIMKKISSYNISVDFIRVLAIIGVVAIHTFNSVYERPDFFNGLTWWFSIVVNSASRICIPLFIMISGYLLIGKDEPFKIIFKRIINRLIVPLFAWTIITYVASNPESISDIFTFTFYSRFFSGNVYYFYFLIILTGLYFVLPLLTNYVNNSSTKAQKFLGISFLMVGVIETAEEYFIRTCSVENSFTKWVPFTGFFLMGYLIGTNKIKVKNKKYLYMIYLIGLFLTVIFNYYFYSQGSVKIQQVNYPGCLSHYSDYYLSFNVVIMALTAFTFLINIKLKMFKHNFIKKAIYDLARASFGIYLIHLFIVSIWDNWLRLTVDNTSLPLFAYLIVKFLGVFIISYLIIVFVKKVPILKKLIGE